MRKSEEQPRKVFLTAKERRERKKMPKNALYICLSCIKEMTQPSLKAMAGKSAKEQLI